MAATRAAMTSWFVIEKGAYLFIEPASIFWIFSP